MGKESERDLRLTERRGADRDTCRQKNRERQRQINRDKQTDREEIFSWPTVAFPLCAMTCNTRGTLLRRESARASWRTDFITGFTDA